MSRILVVEDNELNIWLMRDVLKLRDHVVIEATDVAQALERLREAVPDVVLTDLRLPDASGEELLLHIRGEPALAHLPVVVVTASVMQGERERLLAVGFDGYISKPINTRELAREVEGFAALGAQRHRRPEGL